jgi:hypothetical protein
MKEYSAESVNMAVGKRLQEQKESLRFFPGTSLYPYFVSCGFYATQSPYPGRQNMAEGRDGIIFKPKREVAL